MKQYLVDRRSALKGAGLLSAAAIAALMPSTAWADDDPTRRAVLQVAGK